MQLSSIPTPVITANGHVLSSMQNAHAASQWAAQRVPASGRVPSDVADLVRGARSNVSAALDGVRQLGATKSNVLDATFQRYAGHAANHLDAALSMLADGEPLSKDTGRLLAKQLFDAELTTRLSAAAGERSLAKPELRALIGGSSSGSGTTGSSGSGPVWVDGQWLDGLGNPVRSSGGDSWSGPDGQSFDRDGSPSRGGSGDSWSGPDGASYSGI